MNLKALTRTELLGYSFLTLVYLIGIYYANTNVEYFNSSIAQEDGFVEYTTAIMLLCISVLCISRLIKFGNSKPLLWKIGIAGFALLFMFGAGEEISWGQRIFGIESSEYFIENNAQKETNLHNIVVGETKINKLIFGQILTSVLAFYLLIVPVLYRRTAWVEKLTTLFAVPVPRWNHTISLIAATGLLVSFMKNASKRWELYELAFGVIFFLIFLNPLNIKVFEKEV
ncbi:MAG: hypothetical protein KAH07_01310 [Flavobacteriaceae bacterium]|nr:hypothetical protein [Flavobacteriaceae bacterium]